MTSAMLELAQLFTRDTLPASQLSNDDLKMGCVAWDPSVDNTFHYRPNLAAGVVFTVVFALSLIAHIGQFSWSRKWWYSLFAVGTLGELMGWAARLAAYYCPYNNTTFMLQIAVLIIAPCFYSAALYYILAELIRRWGREYSVLRPNLYLWIFIGFDLFSIVLQGAGGGLAASASGDAGGDPTTGTNLMLSGIAIQLAAMGVFSLLLLWSMFKARPVWLGRGTRTTLFLGTVVLGDVLILTRNFYRAVELGEGWNGMLMTTENYQLVLDGALMAILTVIFNIVHPAWFIGSDTASSYQAEYPAKVTSDSSDEEMAMKRSRGSAS